MRHHLTSGCDSFINFCRHSSREISIGQQFKTLCRCDEKWDARMQLQLNLLIFRCRHEVIYRFLMLMFCRLSPRGDVDFNETMCVFWMTIKDQVTEWGRFNCFDLRRICDPHPVIYHLQMVYWGACWDASAVTHLPVCLLLMSSGSKRQSGKWQPLQCSSSAGTDRKSLKSYLLWHLRPVSIFPYKFIKVIGSKHDWITFTIWSLCVNSFSSHCTWEPFCTTSSQSACHSNIIGILSDTSTCAIYEPTYITHTSQPNWQVRLSYRVVLMMNCRYGWSNTPVKPGSSCESGLILN